MQDFPLTLQSLFRHGQQVFADSRVVTFEGDHSRTATYAHIARRTNQLAGALTRLGIRPGDRVATFAWNTQEHMEAYFAIPCMGAVLHTLNIRLFPDQLDYIANHAEDQVVIVDGTLLPLFAKLRPGMKTVRHVIVTGSGDLSAVPGALRYDELLEKEPVEFEWPVIDEKAAAAMCYTSGTTGNPKGVVYSHRSTWLHSMAACMGSIFGLSERDRILPIVPMFHANAWGLPYAGWLAGSDFVLPGRFLQAEPLCRLIAEHRPTISGAVPTIWNDLLRHAEANPVDLKSLRLVVCGGAAVPRALMENFDKRGVRIVQAWGMTEMSPLGSIAHPPPATPPELEMQWRARAGRIAPGVEARLVDDSGQVLPWDDQAVGEIEVRGPWITAQYYRDDAPEKFHDGWLRTGDVGTISHNGFLRITDRAKDVIKSGGEWIASVELENAIMGHPEVLEAAVIGVPDDRWSERPLACVVRKPGATLQPAALREFLCAHIPHWWQPERWTFLAQVPRTSVGKFDKKVLRAQYAEGRLQIEVLPPAHSRGAVSPP
jgi:fatty-acyl-CoA synthase